LLLTSFNAQRLYEVLWHDSHAGKKLFLTYSLEDLKTYLGLRDPNGVWEKYEQWRDFRKLLLRLQEVINSTGPLQIRKFTGIKQNSRSFSHVRFELFLIDAPNTTSFLLGESPQEASPEVLALAQELRQAGYNQDPFSAIEHYGFDVTSKTLKLARKAQRDALATSNPIKNFGGLLTRMLQRGAAALEANHNEGHTFSKEDAQQTAREWLDAYSLAVSEAATAFWDALAIETRDEILDMMRIELSTIQVRSLDNAQWKGPAFVSARNLYVFKNYQSEFAKELYDVLAYSRSQRFDANYKSEELALVTEVLQVL
jgi:hypothetical protein